MLISACGGATRSAPTTSAGRDTSTAAASATTGRAAATRAPRTGLSARDKACAAATAAACPLKVAAARAGLKIGTAGKFSSPAREALEAQQFSAMSVESQLLWSVVEPAPGKWDFKGADQVVAFAHAHHLALTATHFVWDPPGSLAHVLPAWVGAIDDPAKLLAAMRDYLTTITKRYGDQITTWDTVNEPLALDGSLTANHFRKVLGPTYVEQAFRMAHQIAPHARLYLNEWGAELFPEKANGLVALASRLVHEGVPIMGVGLQDHLQYGDPNWTLYATTMKRLSDLGLTVVVSELDLPIQAKDKSPLTDQATRAAHVVQICLRTPRCNQITFWGFDDGDTWLDSYLHPGTEPLLFTAKLQPKPMFFAVRQALLEGAGQHAR